MAGGYVPGIGGGLDSLREELVGIYRRLAELETPTGTSVTSLVEQVRVALANITTTVTDAIAANSYTRAQTDAKVAAPGNISPGTVAASGNVTSAGQVDSAGAPLKSQPSFNYMVTTAYKGAWIDGVTYQIGYSPSSAVVKTDLQPLTPTDVEKLLTLTPYWGRYLWDSPDSPRKVFFLAADVQAAGFGPDVAPVVEDEPLVMVGADGPVLDADGQPVVIPVGQAYTVNYSQLTVPLLAALQALHAAQAEQEDRITALTARLDAAGL